MQQQQQPQQHQQEAATAADVAERARQNTQTNTAHAIVVKDRTYVSEWRRYKEWVVDERAAGIIPDGPKFLTRENVDLYFSEIIVNRMVVANTARRVVSALQVFADEEEYTDGSETFTIESATVKKALVH